MQHVAAVGSRRAQDLAEFAQCFTALAMPAIAVRALHDHDAGRAAAIRVAQDR
jgi:hypothetical protein